MSDFDDAFAPVPDEAARPNIGEYTVSEIAFSVKRTIEDAFGHVRVRGEISGYRGPHSSGHAYFSLKDDKSRIEAVIWRGQFQRLRFRPEEGMEVVAVGRLTTFPGGSKYQIVIDSLEPAGVGALMALLEKRRRELAAEGLFDEGRKRPLPFLPTVIGVVTSPTGAVIRDILHRLADRFPVHVLVWPVRVQGDTSAREVEAAIRGFNALAPGGAIPRPDLLIVARGGGSLEDLWSFNEEIVVRAAAASEIPLISAVGHETDWTLIDHAADRRAPTPTGAAEMAVPVRADLIAAVDSGARRLDAALTRYLDGRRTEVRAAARALPQPRDLVAPARQRLDLASARLAHALAAAGHQHRARYERAAARLSLRSLARTLDDKRTRLDNAGRRTEAALERAIGRKRADFEALARRLSPDRLARSRDEGRRRLEVAAGRLDRAFAETTRRRRHGLDLAAKLFDGLNYRSVLRRGYAIVRDGADQPLHGAASISPGMRLAIEFADGRIAATAGDGSPPPEPAATPVPRKPRGTARGSSGQGDLF